jgi:RHS repeat-associated protein
MSNIDVAYRFTGKERDEETGLYYYGARYLDSKTGRWLSADPALGEYIPGAPVNDEARKRNQNLPGMGGVFNVVNLHLYHYAGNNPLKYTDPDGKSPVKEDARNDGDWKIEFKRQYILEVRERIVNLAKIHVGSTAWNYAKSKMPFKANTNKCNQFVSDVTRAAGADPGTPNGRFKRSPPTAEQWADPDYEIPGWRVLSPDEKPMPGDVAAQKINYSDATGHSAVVTEDGKTVGTSSIGEESIKETDWGFRDVQKGQVTFRRWEGVE